MYPTDVYLKKLRTILTEHLQVNCAGHMIEILDNANVNKMTTMQLNSQLIRALDDKEMLWPRLKHAVNKKSKDRSEQRKTSLKEALETTMSEVILLKKTPSLPSPRDLPPTPDGFSRGLYLAHLSHWYTDENPEIERKINNSLERVKNVYVKHQDALKDGKLNPHVKSFHQRRVDIILSWIQNEKIDDLIELIKSMHSATRKSDLPLSYNPSDSIEKIQYKQHLLHWLGIILENPVASESPYAMSEILDLLRLPDSELEEIVSQFSEIYVIENAPAWINIDHEERSNFLTRLDQGEISEIRESLTNIYNTLLRLILGADQISNELRKLEDELDLEHPSNRSSKDSISSSSMILSVSSRRSSRIISGAPSPDLTAATLVESSESSKSKLTQ